jgi:carboxymethylenebutenolidase
MRIHRLPRCAPAIVGLSLLAVAPSARAADAVRDRLDKSPRHQEWVDVESAGGRKLKCFVVYPEVSGKALSVIVIHENKGLTDWVRSVADELAEAGYVAIAPDFLSGTGPGGGNTDAYASVDAATKGIYELKSDRVQADLDAAFAYVKKLDAASGKVAVAGFCWGGGQSFAYACKNPDLAAAFVFYGTKPNEPLKEVKIPVYGFYGGNDLRITGEVPTVEAAMKHVGKKYEPVIYSDAGHGFMRAGGEEGAQAADKKAHDEGWSRWKKLLGAL